MKKFVWVLFNDGDDVPITCQLPIIGPNPLEQLAWDVSMCRIQGNRELLPVADVEEQLKRRMYPVEVEVCRFEDWMRLFYDLSSFKYT